MHVLALIWNSPTMMGGYYQKALQNHTKLTCAGPAFGESKNDYSMKPGDLLQPILDQMQDKPDVIICFYSKPDIFPPDLYKIKLPKAWYVYDTHLHLKELSATAYLFDLVICTDEPTRVRMSQSGHNYTKVMGFAADKEFYFRDHHPSRKRKYQVGFAGSVYGHPQLRGRQQFLESLQEDFDVKIEHRTLIGPAVADFFQDCQVVVNHAVNDDLNMRVPEALLSGRPLLTPKVEGLELQYHENEHLIAFDEHNVKQKLKSLLDQPEQAEEMARRGQQWVLEHHTYDHRAEELIGHLKELMDLSSKGSLSSKNELLLEFAQFNYHRFRYPGDATAWLLNNWTPKNAPEKLLKKIVGVFYKGIYWLSKLTKKSYFQTLNSN